MVARFRRGRGLRGGSDAARALPFCVGYVALTVRLSGHAQWYSLLSGLPTVGFGLADAC